MRSEDETPPPTPGRANGKAGVAIDWDDEDEATTVFDRSLEDASRSLLRSAPPPPASGCWCSRADSPSGSPATL